MNMKNRLFGAFGPMLLATLLIIVLFSAPFWLKTTYISPKVQRNAATSISPQIFKGQVIKQDVLDHHYVPFFGSSEWSRFDPFHPSVLATKYHRSYRPFLLGQKGSQSLNHFFIMQSINRQIRNKKAVFFISPQWFLPGGENPRVFSCYYSPLQTADWIQSEKGTSMDRYAAKRLLQMPSGRSDKFIAAALKRIILGTKPTIMQQFFIKYRRQMLLNEDKIYSPFGISDKNTKRISREARRLPNAYHYRQLDQLAGRIGKQHTNNNRFQIANKFWDHRIKNRLPRLKNFQARMSFLKSPEYSDFELVLNQFANDRTKVLFIIPPINKRWQAYTGLSADMLHQFDKKITYQLRSQGFNHIADLSRDGAINYFMTDTIHPGWRGWLKMDQSVRPFLTKKIGEPHYVIKKKFYSKRWQQLVPKD
ncbi:D-alanyl-lipoteichoic acid biosynthesis protein DltD [Lentilactobacillus diolivorans]|uniref:Protein DltD n=2 Tax=Lentilactobacillus diolivorans TaxID=179838 RepID=A0A0R1S8X0_9LACO|nr:D-alanyl-lipoteichoic acid biosynthesis protein DltD [Lentilactobacillus diolivorans]KRL65549.1 D-alanyl transfer protein DltD [Lentilactobacillus diolivorans DSM 14421]GEP25201.1 D-alanyl-lipoteichoic acid biosynthesis protein DltD [Lentilactobacillus diolivorans]